MLRIGVDVCGTNTDAALLRGTKVLATIKTGTTADVTSGAGAAIRAVLLAAQVRASDVSGVMIGTTHFLNAVTNVIHGTVILTSIDFTPICNVRVPTLYQFLHSGNINTAVVQPVFNFWHVLFKKTSVSTN